MRPWRAATPVFLVVATLGIGLSADSNDHTEGTHPETQSPKRQLAARGSELPWLYIETGDLTELRKRGNLRILLLQSHPQSSTIDLQQPLITRFAEGLGLHPVWVPVENTDDLLPYLLDGRGDIIVSDIPAEPESLTQVARTLPLEGARYPLITRRGETECRSPADLPGREVALKRSAPAWSLLERFQASYPSIRLRAIPEHLDRQTILDLVAAGHFDLTVLDTSDGDPLEEASDLKVAFHLIPDQPQHWLLRPGNTALRAALNRSLNQYQLAHRPPVYRADLSQLKRRRVLRVITQPDRFNYFLRGGQPAGFAHELVLRFAREMGLRIETLVALTDAEMLRWLKQGKGDLITARISTAKVSADPDIEFSKAYNHVMPVVIARSGDSTVNRPTDLAHRRIVLRPDLNDWHLLADLRTAGIPLKSVTASAKLKLGDLVDGVARGEYDLALVSSHQVKTVLGDRSDVKAAFSLDSQRLYRWALRSENRELLGAVNDFLKREYRGRFYNVLYNKYFGNMADGYTGSDWPADSDARISPYDDLVKTVADRYGFDWRLIVAQMYQESRFKPKAVSAAGATGLMQLLPRTAKDLGVSDTEDPETAIHAGIQYLDRLRDRFGPHLEIGERIWFALAAYNAGFERVRDARHYALQLNLDPNRWFDNVEHAMVALADPANASHTRFGPCRCAQTVRYVREIRALYAAYVQLTDPVRLTSVGDPDRQGG